MEFQYQVRELLSNNFLVINETDVVSYYKINNDDRRRYYMQLEKLIDSLGELSAQEQMLKKPITTFKNLINTNHTIYMAMDPEFNNGLGAATGYIKVGKKKLFLTDGIQEQVAVDIPCVLDFYVYKDQQRKGWGRRIFDHMLEMESLTPGTMAYDRPSPKLIKFLRKHYDLTNTIWQPNRYTIYKDYFDRYSNSHISDKYSNRTTSLGKLLAQDNRYIPDSVNGPPTSQRRLDSISKIIQQVPPSP